MKNMALRSIPGELDILKKFASKVKQPTIKGLQPHKVKTLVGGFHRKTPEVGLFLLFICLEAKLNNLR